MTDPSDLPRHRVIVVNLGTPAASTEAAVREFLEEFLSDPAVIDFPRWLWQPILRRAVLKRRPARVAALYREIWTEDGSPLEAGTRRIAAGLSALLPDADVACAYRYGARSIERALVAGLAEGAGPQIVVPLYAQRTSSTTGTVVDEVARAAAALRIADRTRVAILPPGDDGYAQANAARFRAAVDAAGWEPDHLLISLHGIPRRYDRREAGTYSSDCEHTTRAILEALDWPPERATLCYQSKFGPEPWLTPATADLLASLPDRGVRRVGIMTPGFLTEGLETIEEIGVQGKESFLDAGGTHFLRVPTVEDHPAFLEALARTVTNL